ncbi:restriction endonuclease subunit S [Odoribacter splanchnicus]|jgi:type I restriction modification DNA specificity domain protein|uniref:restriction endonuclease subunit S n=1 Tax=Odoribacter splanchnicus TaxID=28118 RepID=UPI000ED5626F|nr:restriction endonuclease subunit S [Odoribacter splanchnicus]MRZ84233.1 restriction endonuclease subunit S [Odoribacter splanchnicus]HCL19663.1 restriction endonuclease subunit S [Odoribacter splanchnicus]HCU28200.1 restriction endonuclease subunit S [Odoribacter splanchnicus]
MSKLQDLIQKLCPDGVEYKKLGDVCELSRGKVYSKTYIVENAGEYPVYSSQTANNGELGRISTFDYDGEYLTWTTDGAYAGTIFHRKGKFSITNVCGLISIKITDLSIRFLYYWLSIKAKEHVYSGMGNPKLMSNQMIPIEVPIPPLKVQEEIVKILDRFAEYAAELQAELQARQEQYEYYRNKLLSFSDINREHTDVTWMKMSEIGSFIRGKRFVRTDIVNDGVPCIHYGDMYTYYGLYATQSKGWLRNELASKMRYAQKNDVVIVAAGENKEDIGIGLAWLGDEPAAVHDACFIFRSNLYPQYVSHYLRSNYYHRQIVKYVSEGKICSISAKGLGNAIIPIPTYEEQVRIATLLNNFEALVSDLSQGLPAEITAVQEQYEYYRNKLLSFPRNEKISA